ncbi:MAG TPA: sugar ABC transporter substrate-binding protein [Pseudonocardiaceae bacterium]|nr:sugar ABC transporter substrate-binding protein [Pseudonocardiaceae bacterium]
MFSRRLSTRLATIALASATAFTLAGCGEDSTSGESSSNNSQSGAGKTLTVWIMEGTNPDATPFFDKVKSDFKAQTGAEVDIQFVPWANAHDKFVNAVGGGETPDVAEVGTTWTPEFADAGILADLSDRVKDKDPLVDSLVTAGELDGKLYGMPWYAGVRSIVYRADVFNELNIEPPTSWDELVAAGQKIKAGKPDMIPFPVAGDSTFGLLPFIWGAGGEVAEQDGDAWKSTLDSAQAREGIQFYTDLALKHGLSTPAATTWKETNLRDEFVKGTVAMMISGSWTPKSILQKAPQLEGKIGAFGIPGPDGGLSRSFVGGSHLAVFDNSDEKDLSWKFVELMTSEANAADWASQSSFFPGIESLLEKATAADDPLVSPFAAQMKDAGESVPVTPAWGKVEAKKTIGAMLQAILSGSKTVEQATADAAAEMTDTLKG